MQPRFQKAATRIAVSGATITFLALATFALATRYAVRSILLQDMDEELDTLSVAIASDLELHGLGGASYEALRSGVEANTLAFRLQHHSAILFDDKKILATTGDLVRNTQPDQMRTFAKRDETPFTAREPFSGQQHVSRFRVAHLQQNARGTTLVVFRSIEAGARILRIVDIALAILVAAGFVVSVLILALAVRRALQPVEELTDQLERSVGAQRRLVADAAHELKTPAAVIAAEAQELARGRLKGAEQQQALMTIARAAAGLSREVDDILELARADALHVRTSSTFDFDDAIDEALLISRGLAGERDISVVKEGDASCAVTGDRVGLTRALTNLLSNAVRYSPPSSEVRVAARLVNGTCEIEVADRGPGISPADRERIFDRFVRLPVARKEYPEGSGLGLAIVRQVVDAHHGAIEVMEREGGGTVFRLRIPVAN